MNAFKLVSLITIFSFFVKILVAQDVSMEPEKIYGVDPEIYNGVIYDFFLLPETKGNQYFTGPAFMDGDVVIKGILYHHLKINYDIFNQQLLLKSENSHYSGVIIALSQGWLESFTFGNARFELVRFPDSTRKICEVIGQGRLRMLYCWYKEQKIDYDRTSPFYVFSKPKKQAFLQINESIRPCSSNKSFVACFEQKDQAALKEYLKSNKFNFRKTSHDKLLGLISFCNTLVQ
ncbi:MAG: hypothetical protein HXX13_14385 [Bacteroidetes bacterium]|nr:hypothetical protein [Bacteroidota bacterium]